MDLSALADWVLGELRQRHPERSVTTEVQPGLMAQVDPRLFQVAFENLLDNAWKFTAQAEAARIQFTRETLPDGLTAFCIRDNGAGFDMAYSGKLFDAFQRLHSAEKFEGTGIGLAIVQRIIHRHGGRIWGEGAVDQGAAFFFTLPDPEPGSDVVR